MLPEQGGKIVGMRFIGGDRDYVWFDEAQAAKYNPDEDYDPQFSGGMEELLPSDVPEEVDGLFYPDHGELWRVPLDARRMCDTEAVVSGTLSHTGFSYSRKMELEGSSLVCTTTIRNIGDRSKPFLWKLHCALNIAPGDRIEIPAGCMTAADVDWSTLPDTMPRRFGGTIDVPEKDGSSEFLYLTDLHESFCAAHFADGHSLRCEFDSSIFTSIWYFGTYGKLNGSYTAILEPCTNYPMSVNDAMKANSCARLGAGDSLTTTVKWTLT